MRPLQPAPWLAVALLLTGLVLLVAVLRAWQVAAAPNPELVRKLFHLGGGMLALPLPWLFSSPGPVVVLASFALLLLGMLRAIPLLRSGPGQVLAAVERHTVGEFCFIVSVMVLFVLAHDRPLLYGVPLLVLALADAFAALVGRDYGRHFYNVKGGTKSIEGSLVFFVAAFLCVHVPVLLFTDTPRLETLLIGINIALMVMMAEAAAWWGLDNLIIPLFSYVLLRTFFHLDALALMQHLAFLTGLSLFIRFWRPRTNLADDALFGVSLWGYLAWAIAGWQWVVPALILISLYTAVTRHTPADQVRRFNFPVALANLFGSLVWLFAYSRTGDPLMFAPFAAVYGADLAIIALVRHRRALPQVALSRSIAASAGKGILLLVPSILLYQGASFAALASIGAASLAVGAATVLFARFQPGLEQFPIGNDRWLRQAACAAAGSLLALAPALLPAAGGWQ